MIHQPELVIGACIRRRALSKARSERSPPTDAATLDPPSAWMVSQDVRPGARGPRGPKMLASKKARRLHNRANRGRAVRPFVEARDASASSIYLMTSWIARVCGSAVRSVGGPNQSASVGAFPRPVQRMSESRTTPSDRRGPPSIATG